MNREQRIHEARLKVLAYMQAEEVKGVDDGNQRKA